MITSARAPVVCESGAVTSIRQPATLLNRKASERSSKFVTYLLRKRIQLLTRAVSSSGQCLSPLCWAQNRAIADLKKERESLATRAPMKLTCLSCLRAVLTRGSPRRLLNRKASERSSMKNGCGNGPTGAQKRFYGHPGRRKGMFPLIPKISVPTQVKLPR
jgi:hypothetical protein